jgi:hypothetical protein
VWLGRTTVSAVAGAAMTGQIEAVAVGGDWSALGRQGLRARVTLVRPDVVLVLSPEAVPAPRAEPEAAIPQGGGFAIAQRLAALSTLQIEDGALTLRAGEHSATLRGVQATVQRSEDRSTLALAGRLGQGHLRAQGTLDWPQGLLRVTTQADHVPLDSFNLVLSPALSLQAGTLDSRLELSSSLAEVGLGRWQLEGTTTVHQGRGHWAPWSTPIDQVQGTLNLGEKRLRLTDARLGIGPLSLDVAATLDPTGYDFAAEAAPLAAAELRGLIGDRLPLAPSQTWQGRARLTGPDSEIALALEPDPSLAPPGQLSLDLGLVGVALGLQSQGLPARDWISPLEGATYQFGQDGAWFTLSDGTVVPPLSEGAYRGARAALGPALDRKFFWLLQTNPYITAIAADLASGRLHPYRQGQRFSTDRFFQEFFAPVYAESSRVAGLDPGEALWMLDHSLRTLHDPLLRHPDARPITAGAGGVGSFWADEQLLSMQQLLARPLLAQSGQPGRWARWAVLKQLDASTSLESRRLSSTPELMAKIPNVTVGAEEGAIALALGIMRLPGEGIYPASLRSLAAAIEQNERDKHATRTALTDRLTQLSTDHRRRLGFALIAFSDRDWARVGLGKQLSPGGATHLTGGNTLSVMVSRQEKAGYSLDQAFQNSRLLLLELLHRIEADPEGDRILFAVLKDHALTPQFWALLAQKEPSLAGALGPVETDAARYRQLAQQGADLHEQFYGELVRAREDIGVSAAIKQAVGFQAHLGGLIDQVFAPPDPGDGRYRAFRRSLAIYLREAPDISAYGGTEASLRAYGLETLNVQELIAVDGADAPRLRAMARLYREALAHGLIEEWDIPGFQRLLLTGALLAAGVERAELPPALRSVGFPSPEFRRNLLFVVGAEGIHVEATRLGVQAHDHRVSFQPMPLPAYRPPALTVADPASCPSRPHLRAIALGAAVAFAWDAETQRVVLRRGMASCPLPDNWGAIFFPALLESVPIEHSERGRDFLQTKLHEAQRLEAGIF